MFRSRLLIDRRLFRTRNNREASPTDAEINNRISKLSQDSNNNNIRTDISNNFDFIEPCDIDKQVDSLESLKIKNWKYHLTNNKF